MNTITELRKFVAPEIIMGVDARLMIGRYIGHFASKRPMIVTDRNLEALPWFADILSEFEKYDIASKLIGNLITSKTTNPRMKEKSRDLKDIVLKKMKEKGLV